MKGKGKQAPKEHLNLILSERLAKFKGRLQGIIAGKENVQAIYHGIRRSKLNQLSLLTFQQ